jgi:uncharacterized protein YdaU (DUF1376 family)
VNFYKHYIGDFQRSTSHLSLTERGAYLALIHYYYATERPLPNDHAVLCRIAGAMTRRERDAVKSVMSLFSSVESGLMQDRIEVEIQKAGDISSTNRAIALAREENRRAKKAHETCTNRVTGVDRIDHGKSTNQNQNQNQNQIPLPPAAIIARTWWPSTNTLRDLDMVHGYSVEWTQQQVPSFVAYWVDRNEPRPSWDALFIQHCETRSKIKVAQ